MLNRRKKIYSHSFITHSFTFHTTRKSIKSIISPSLQQQIHAQQIPGAPPQSIPSALGPLGPLGAFAGPMGLPHGGPQSLLKNPQDLHREDIKVPLAGPSAEERLVR
jgi:hypothetical protein